MKVQSHQSLNTVLMSLNWYDFDINSYIIIVTIVTKIISNFIFIVIIVNFDESSARLILHLMKFTKIMPLKKLSILALVLKLW
jgi:hypothetical protein